MSGQTQKKRKAAKQHAYNKQGKRLRLRSDRETASANAWFFIREMFVEEFLYHCTLPTIMALSKTCQYSRDLVKAFFLANLRLLVEIFVGNPNVVAFYEVLETSRSVMAGSVVSSVLTSPYRHSWKPDNLNLLVPRNNIHMWRDFFYSVGFSEIVDPEGITVSIKHQPGTRSYSIFSAFTPGTTIRLSESKDASILRPLLTATSTFAMNMASCSDIYCFYPALTTQNQAVEGWFPISVLAAMAMHGRNIRSSLSSTGWDGPCGWACPVLWRYVKGLEGVGVFRWGGYKNQHADNGSTVGVPVTNNALKWRLGDTCRNAHCPWRNATYLNFNPYNTG